MSGIRTVIMLGVVIVIALVLLAHVYPQFANLIATVSRAMVGSIVMSIGEMEVPNV